MPRSIFRPHGASRSFHRSKYVDRFFVDSAVLDDRTLQFLVNIMEPDQVALGSDYPFPLGEERPGTLVRTARVAAGGEGQSSWRQRQKISRA
jgi:hypothetical protein